MNDVIYTNSKKFENRGSIYTIYDQKSLGIHFVQDKISKSFQGVIRGFHGDNTTWKFITCLYGKIKLITYNIDTDIKNTYILDGDDKDSISVLISPRTLNAHQCLSSECIFYYKWSEFYTSPSDQWSVNYNDSDISPDWSTDFCDIISDRDKNSGSLQDLKKRIL